MILPSELYQACLKLHPGLDCTESDTREYLESNPLVADCNDLKYVANLFTDWYLKSI